MRGMEALRITLRFSTHGYVTARTDTPADTTYIARLAEAIKIKRTSASTDTTRGESLFLLVILILSMQMEHWIICLILHTQVEDKGVSCRDILLSSAVMIFGNT